MENYLISPWVVNKNEYFLGPKLKVIKTSLKDLNLLSKESLNYLQNLQFIVSSTSLYIHNKFPAPIQDKKALNGQDCCWLWITDKNLLKLGYDIYDSLSSKNPNLTWMITTNKRNIIQHLQNNKQQFNRFIVIPFSNNEPISDRAIKRKFDGLLNAEILWMGECLDGLHLGPIVSSLDHLSDYKKCTQEWSSTKNLFNLGFKDYWPLSLHNAIVNYKETVVQAILKIIQPKFYTGKCILIESNKEVKIWPALRNFSVSENEFFKTQLWSKGLIKSFKASQLHSFKNIFISECKSPAQGLSYLEGNSGKGLTPKRATYSAIGEAVERFSALEANFLLPKTIDKNKWQIYTLDQFHPFGRKWEQYLAAGKPNIPLQLTKNELEENDFAYVPECLIPFPYLPTETSHNVTASSTGGLAVYSNYEEAVIKGTLEILERNNFYPSFLNLKDGLQLNMDALYSIDDPKYKSLCKNLISLKKMSLEVWLIIYKDCFDLPIIHCFLLDKANHFFSRGSGSGYTWFSAIEHAFLEALQIRQQFITFKEKPVSSAYNNWRMDEVIQKILIYINNFPKVTLDMAERYTKNELFIKIKKTLKELQKPLLVARLPEIINTWSSVRILIPSLTSHQYPSYSEGGKSLLNPSFIYGVPS